MKFSTYACYIPFINNLSCTPSYRNGITNLNATTLKSRLHSNESMKMSSLCFCTVRKVAILNNRVLSIFSFIPKNSMTKCAESFHSNASLFCIVCQSNLKCPFSISLAICVWHCLTICIQWKYLRFSVVLSSGSLVIVKCLLFDLNWMKFCFLDLI